MSTQLFGVTSRIYNYSHTIGQRGYSGNSFVTALDFALGKEGRLYVFNRSTEWRPDGVRVTICTIDEEFLGSIGRFGEGEGEFVWPASIAVDSNENVYCADEWLQRISVFSSDGKFKYMWGTAGNGDGELNKPSGLAFDKDDNLYIVDSANNRIQKFTKEGKFLFNWGREGKGEGEFNLPWGITIDHNDDVWVADWRNDRVQKFTADGDFLASFGSSGTEIGRFHRPTGVAVDKDGDFYVTEVENDRMQAFTPDGRFITAFTGDGTVSKWGEQKLHANPDQIRQRAVLRAKEKESERKFWRPTAVKVDDEQRVIVNDSQRHRLQVYQKVS